MGTIQPTSTGPSLDLGRQFPVPDDLAAIRADPDGCREAIRQIGELHGYPDLNIGATLLHGGEDGWRDALGRCIPTWLAFIWEAIDPTLRKWEERGGVYQSPYDCHLVGVESRTCADCGGRLEGSRLYRCDDCLHIHRRKWYRPTTEPKQNTAESAGTITAKAKKPAAGRRSLTHGND